MDDRRIYISAKLKEAERIIGDDSVISLCPKTTFALIGVEKAEFVDVPVDGQMRYMDACAQMPGKAHLLGRIVSRNLVYSAWMKDKGSPPLIETDHFT